MTDHKLEFATLRQSEDRRIFVVADSLLKFLETREHYRALKDIKMLLSDFQDGMEGFPLRDGGRFEEN